ncbi:fimbria/pilus outer membrane usher protein [Atlantibacter subterraneus]|uniref:fimbria/pilus outer membrane usher protein n=2 Tax=Atlantibacter subterraneus TaxID=255519 RepID=UPI0028A9C14E|nr:fimbria/pilus outer membrane usher protein [Atlantibacter subterranea]
MRRFVHYSSLMALLLAPCVQARETFNIHALEIDNPGQPVADLSAFAEAEGQQPGEYQVTVYVNGEQQGDVQNVNFVAGADKKLNAQLTPALLRAWGVKIDAFPALAALAPDHALEDIGQYIPLAATEFRFSKLQLNVSIPQAAMDSTARGQVDPAQWDEGVPAALLNYNVSGSHTQYSEGEGADSNQYASLQSGLNFGPWRLRNDSTWNYDERNGSHWNSINTQLQRDIRTLKAQMTLGDSYTPSDVFDSVPLRGAQLASDDNMLPDSLRGFAPVIRGIAQSNAQVTVKQNGYTIYQTYVAPGAFTINDLYPTAGSGDLDVTIKESDGTERHFVQPFSAVPLMQREGRLKYAFAAGKYRSDGGAEPQFGQLTAIYGLPHSTTLYGGVIYADNYQAGALGLGIGLGELGSLSADATVARAMPVNSANHSGQSYRLQYSKDIQATGTNFTLATYRYSTEGYYSFQETNDRQDGDNRDALDHNKRQKLQLDISQRLGAMGSFFISGYQQDYWGEKGYERTLSAGWNGSINGINYSIAYSYSEMPDSDTAADQQLAFSIQVPLSRFLSNAWASYSVTSAKQGNTRQQLGINGTALADNNLSYNVQQSYTNQGAGASGMLSATWKGGYGEVSGGYNYDDAMRQVNYGLKGGVVAHPHGVTFSQSLGQSLAIVKAPGANDTRIQNNTGIYTDWRGYAVVPYVTPYKKNRVALDPSTLRDDVDIDTAVQTVIPTQGAVVMADFNTRVGRRALMTLIYRGLPVPFGAEAKLSDGGSGIVGDDGQVYLSGVPERGEIVVSWSGAERCRVHYQLPDSSADVPVLETEQECR